MINLSHFQQQLLIDLVDQCMLLNDYNKFTHKHKLQCNAMYEDWCFCYDTGMNFHFQEKQRVKLERKERWEATKRGREEREEQNKLGREGTLEAGRELFKSGFCCQLRNSKARTKHS